MNTQVDSSNMYSWLILLDSLSTRNTIYCQTRPPEWYSYGIQTTSRPRNRSWRRRSWSRASRTRLRSMKWWRRCWRVAVQRTRARTTIVRMWRVRSRRLRGLKSGRVTTMIAREILYRAMTARTPLLTFRGWLGRLSLSTRRVHFRSGLGLWARATDGLAQAPKTQWWALETNLRRADPKNLPEEVEEKVASWSKKARKNADLRDRQHQPFLNHPSLRECRKHRTKKRMIGKNWKSSSV